MKSKAWVIMPHTIRKGDNGVEVENEILPLVLCCDCKHYKDILNGVMEQATIPYDMKWNPDCEDCLPEGINDCIECHKRHEGR